MPLETEHGRSNLRISYEENSQDNLISYRFVSVGLFA